MKKTEETKMQRTLEMKPTSVDDYINQLPEEAKAKTKEIRAILKKVVPEADEILKWGKPTFVLNTILFAYSAHQSHLTFFPTGPSLEPFKDELNAYIVNKDSIRFPYKEHLPVELIEKIAKFRKDDVLERNAKWRY